MYKLLAEFPARWCVLLEYLAQADPYDPAQRVEIGRLIGERRRAGGISHTRARVEDIVDAEAEAGATEQRDTWWNDWSRWLAERAGARREPPTLGSGQHPPTGPAPGEYVRS